jgi:hypothetical protein
MLLVIFLLPAFRSSWGRVKITQNTLTIETSRHQGWKGCDLTPCRRVISHKLTALSGNARFHLLWYGKV